MLRILGACTACVLTLALGPGCADDAPLPRPFPAIPAPTAAFGATSTSSTAYRGLGAAADDEAEQPRWNACSASALDEAEADDLPAIPPPEWANASSLILD